MSDYTSLFEAQKAADEQTESAIRPLRRKQFLLDRQEIDILPFIKENDLRPDQIEKICNLKVGSFCLLSHNSFRGKLQRIT